MKRLGIDWGEAKIGLALADGPLAEPWKVIRYQKVEKLKEELTRVVRDQEIEEIVVGISEGFSGQKAREFGENLKDLGVKISFGDETLTTHKAQQMVKRGRDEDAVAAAFMLQEFLDSQ